MTDAQRYELGVINGTVNRTYKYKKDRSGYQLGDSWDIMGPSNTTGDCEDFALTKVDLLIKAGWHPRHLQMGLCWTELGEYHAVLGVQTTNYGFLILDNRFPYPMTKEQLEGRMYNFDNFQYKGEDWAYYSKRSQGVPIEYMSCGASVFLDNDHVIVEFEDQDFNNPKVIGFVTDPVYCESFLYALYGTAQIVNQVWAYGPETDTWLEKTFTPWIRDWEEIAGINYGQTAFIFGGWRWPGYDYLVWVENWVEKYDSLSNSIQILQAYSGSDRYYNDGFGINNYAYIVGGTELAKGDNREWEQNKRLFQENSQYDFITTATELKADYPYKLWLHVGISAGGYGYIFGGRTNEKFPFPDPPPAILTEDIIKYDKDADIWAKNGEMPDARAWHQAFEAGGNVFVACGSTSAGLVKTAIKYDHVTTITSWIANAPQWNHLCYGAKKGVNSKGYMTSHYGSPDIFDENNFAMWSYDPLTNTWNVGLTEPYIEGRGSYNTRSGTLVGL